MEEFFPEMSGSFKPDVLTPDEFRARYEAIECLLIETRENNDEVLFDIMSEEKQRIELENPNAMIRLSKKSTR